MTYDGVLELCRLFQRPVVSFARDRYTDAELDEWVRGAVAMNGPIQLPLFNGEGR